MLKEFRDFLLKQNAFALAVAVIIGAAVSKVVSGIVDDLIMPVVGVILPGGEWRTAQLTLSGNNAIKYGDFLGRVVDFVIISFVTFLILKTALRGKPKEAPAVKTCSYCLEVVPAAATRCRACTSQLA
jgi:large conductance mechanosensitive channel